MVHHQAGRLNQAETLYRQILQVSPEHADALHLLGVIAYQVGKYDVAIDLISEAVGLKSSNPTYFNNLGLACNSLGRYDEAVACFQQALAIRSDYAEAHANLGNALQELGRLEAAVISYQRALALKPDFANSHSNLGNTFRKLGQLNAAVASYQRAVGLKPGFANLHNDLGSVLQELGQFETAAASYQRALELEPGFVNSHNNLGNTLRKLGQLDAAAASYQRALELKQDSAEVHCNLGVVLQEQGKLGEAVASIHKALSFNPDFAEAHYNLGNVLGYQGKFEEAVASYQRTLELDPGFVQAHSNLGCVLKELDQTDAAVVSCLRALQIKENSVTKSGFVQCVKNINFLHDHAGIRHYLARAISEPWGRPGDLASVSIGLIKLNQNIGECIERAKLAWPTRLTGQELLGASGLASVSHDRLLQHLLENTTVCDLELERFLTMVRFAMLDAAMADESLCGTRIYSFEELDEDALSFCCSLAQQCFINEYVFPCTKAEFAWACLLRDKLVTALASDLPAPVLWLVTVAAYFPLSSLPSVEALLDQPWPDAVATLLVQQIGEPLEERQYRSGIPRLTTVENDVSRLVQKQYEENPYPRWVKSPPGGEIVTIDAFVRRHYPFAPSSSLGKNGEIDILIAGCGTGQHSIETARQYRGARVLAIDLSLTSLCYAKRKTHEVGLENIEYAQADIMRLGTIGKVFDVVESVGVLHHLADPIAGWRVLLSLLRPGGFMRLGLYSKLARQHIVAARHYISQQGYAGNAEDIRQCRQELISMENSWDWERLSTSRDFYGMSTCRDLLFHVQEHCFSLPQLKECLGDLGADFIGFSHEPHVIKKYKDRFPDDKSMTNLNLWNIFENENPNTFAGMYQFWIRKPD